MGEWVMLPGHGQRTLLLAELKMTSRAYRQLPSRDYFTYLSCSARRWLLFFSEPLLCQVQVFASALLGVEFVVLLFALRQCMVRVVCVVPARPESKANLELAAS